MDFDHRVLDDDRVRRIPVYPAGATMTPWQVTYPNTLRENLITRGPLMILAALLVLVALGIEFARAGMARKVS
jgi:hypothetical protein